MNIQYVMLGLLDFEPMTGYDIKKVMQSSPLAYWSGNNSQIYKALAELQGNGYITAEILHNENSPTKKRYTLTELGRRELRDLSRTFPELPSLRNTFILQLTFGRDLSKDELQILLEQYERELTGFLTTINSQALPKADTAFESVIRDLTIQNIRQFYENELCFIKEVRAKALPLAKNNEEPVKKEENNMECTTVNKNGQVYVTVTGGKIRTEQDGLDLVSVCVEHGTNLLLLPGACLSDDFLRLSTRVAGFVLQKLGNYNIKTAAVIDVNNTQGHLKEFLSELNQGHSFHFYANMEEAEAWLLEGF